MFNSIWVTLCMFTLKFPYDIMVLDLLRRRMSVKLVEVTCPKCGAKLEIAEDRKECYCTYCGTKLIIDDGSYTVTHVYVNKARLKEIEHKENLLHINREREKEDRNTKLIIALSLSIAMLVIFLTYAILHTDFNIVFNFSIMLIGCAVAFARIANKSSSIGSVILSALTIGACIAFIMMRDDFNTTFTMTLVVIIATNIIASIFKKDKIN